MLARYIRLMLLCELVAYMAIAEWLHFIYGWDRAALAGGAVAIALASRLLMVCITTALGWKLGSVPAPAHRMGFPGYVALILREWLVVLKNNFYRLAFPGWSVRPDPPLASAEHIPVLLVHGYFCNRGLWSHVVPRLEARGVAPIFVPSFSAAFASIEHFAGELEAEIDRITNATGQPRVILVCHSMGGLASRVYLCKRGADRVARLITIASPHNGTVHALLGAGENARQMERASKFLGELCAAEGERGPACDVVSIYTPHDNLVAPQDTSALPWAKNIALPGLGHLDILSSKALEDVLIAELQDCGVRTD